VYFEDCLTNFFVSVRAGYDDGYGGRGGGGYDRY
jgi:hypothetical protein